MSEHIWVLRRTNNLHVRHILIRLNNNNRSNNNNMGKLLTKNLLFLTLLTCIYCQTTPVDEEVRMNVCTSVLQQSQKLFCQILGTFSTCQLALKVDIEKIKVLERLVKAAHSRVREVQFIQVRLGQASLICNLQCFNL